MFYILLIEWCFFIPFISAVCQQICQNGGKCVAPNTCQCGSVYSGQWCQICKCLYRDLWDYLMTGLFIYIHRLLLEEFSRNVTALNFYPKRKGCLSRWSYLKSPHYVSGSKRRLFNYAHSNMFFKQLKIIIKFQVFTFFWRYSYMDHTRNVLKASRCIVKGN